MIIYGGLSFSKISCFLQCPGKYALHYHKRVKVPQTEPGENLVIGSLIHEALDIMGKGETKDVDDAIMKAMKTVDKIITPAVLRQSTEIIRGWYNETKFNPLPMSTEQEFNMDLGDGCTIMGFIDRVDRIGISGIKITDFKTGMSFYGEEALQDNFQLLIYAVAARALYDPSNIEIGYDLVRLNKTVYRAVDLADIPKYILLIKNINTKILEMEADNAPFIISNLCGWCDYRYQCESLKTYLSDITNEEITLDMDQDMDKIAKTINDLSIREKLDGIRLNEIKGFLTTILDSASVPELRTKDWEVGLKYRKGVAYSYVKKL